MEGVSSGCAGQLEVPHQSQDGSGPLGCTGNERLVGAGWDRAVLHIPLFLLSCENMRTSTLNHLCGAQTEPEPPLSLWDVENRIWVMGTEHIGSRAAQWSLLSLQRLPWHP